MTLLRSLAYLHRRYKVTHLMNHRCNIIMMSRDRGLATLNQAQFDQNFNIGQVNKSKTSIDMIRPIQNKPPPRSSFSTWAKWVVGSILTLLFPLQKKWATLLRIEGEVEMAAEAVEEVAEAVEKVAMVVEQVSSEVAEKLPEDGKLRSAALMVEHVSRQAAEEAHLVVDIIHKVDDVKQEVESLVDSIVDGKEKKEQF